MSITCCRFVRDVGLIRPSRQISGVCEDGNDTQCLPDGIDNLPTREGLVQCVAGERSN